MNRRRRERCRPWQCRPGSGVVCAKPKLNSRERCRPWQCRPGVRINAGVALVAWMLAAVTTVGCGSGDGNGSVSRGDVLTDLAAEAIVPAYERMTTSAHGLLQTAEALCDAARSGIPLDTVLVRLGEARAALADTLARWSFLEAMWTGPVMDRRSWAVIDWPVDTDEIEALIADGEPIDIERLALRIGADQRGLRAVEHILGIAAPAEDTAAAVVGALGDRRRCDYLTGITGVIAKEADLLHADWAVTWEDGPAYPDMWTAPDGGDGVDDLVNGSLFLLDAISDRELGTAIGLMSDPAEAEEPPEAEESSVLVVSDMREHLRGLRAVLVGEGPGTSGGSRGLGPLLGTELFHRLHGLIEEADAALSPLAPRLLITPDQPLEDLEQARDAVKAVQVAVATEVVSRLGVAIGFSDADGDSSN